MINKGIQGMEQVMVNLNKELAKIKGKSLSGLIKAGIILRRDMEKGIVRTPHEFGNLRASFFMTTIKSTRSQASFTGADAGKMGAEHSTAISEAKSMVAVKREPVMIMGYSAFYGVYVHEMPITTNWTREGSGPKWFELAVTRNTKKMVQTVADDIRKGI